LKDEQISDTNQKLVLNFVNHCFSEGIGEYRTPKYLSTLKIVAKSISSDFDKATEDEIRYILEVLKDQLLTTGQRMTIKQCKKVHTIEELFFRTQ